MLLIEEIGRARVADREREIAAGIRRRALLGPRRGLPRVAPVGRPAAAPAPSPAAR
jgi:hypothetical protein